MLRCITILSQVLCVLLVWVILPIAQAEEIIDERFVLTRFTEGGSVDNSFGDRGIFWYTFPYPIPHVRDSYGEALAVDKQGRITAAGWAVVHPQEQPTIALMRHLPNGRLDPSFGSYNLGRKVRQIKEEDFSRAYAVAIDPRDGAIVVAGDAGYHGKTQIAVARYLEKGKQDPYFGGGLVHADFGDVQSSSGQAVAIDEEGKIIVAGHAHHEGEGKFAILRYQRDGTLDPDFGDKGRVLTSFSDVYTGALDARATAVGIDDEGRIVVAGSIRGIFELIGGNAEKVFGVARYKSNGDLDKKNLAEDYKGFSSDGLLTIHFGPGSSAQASALAIERTTIIVAGSVTHGNKIRFAVASIKPEGVFNKAFNGGRQTIEWDESATGDAMVVQPNGEVVIAGTIYKDPPTFGVTRLKTNGKLDTDFGNGGRSEYEPVYWSRAQVGGMALDNKGRILVGGFGRVIDRLPERGSIPEMFVALDWNPGAAEVSDIAKLCTAVNQSMYITLDGQAFIKKFTIVDKNHAGDFIDDPYKYGQTPFVPRAILSKDISKQTMMIPSAPSADDPYPGRPEKPEYFQIVTHPPYSWWWQYQGEMTYFLYSAYTGVSLDWPEGVETAPHHCNLDTGMPNTDWLYHISPYELCRGVWHNPANLQGQLRGMSCYDWIVKALAYPGMEVPTVDIVGPTPSKTPVLVIKGTENILPSAIRTNLSKYQYLDGLKDIDPYVREGLILHTPEGKKISIGLSAHSEWEKEYTGYTNGKLIVKVVDEETGKEAKIERLEIMFEAEHIGKDLSSLEQKHVSFTPVKGTYNQGTYFHDQLKKSRSTYRVRVVVEDVSYIEWQHWKNVMFGSDWPGAFVWSAYTDAHIFIEDEGRHYSQTLMGGEHLGWEADTAGEDLIQFLEEIIPDWSPW